MKTLIALICILLFFSCTHQGLVRPFQTPAEIKAALSRADALLECGKTDSARVLYLSLRDPADTNLRALAGLGRVALAERRWDDALGLATEGLKRDEGSTVFHYIAAIAEREIGASLLWRNAHWTTSRAHLERVLARDSSFEDVLYQFAILERYNGYGEYIQARGDAYRDHAIGLARAQLEKKPGLVAAQLGLYKLYAYYMAVEDSSDFLPFLRRQPGAVARYFEGETLRRHLDLAGADSVFAALLLKPEEVSPQAIRLARARLRIQRGDRAGAEAEYWRAVQDLRTQLGAAILFEDVKYVVADAELDYYRGLDAVDAKRDFFRSFWNFRNPSLALRSNLRLQEHIRRRTVAEQRYEFYGFRSWFSTPDRELRFPRAYTLNEEYNDLGLIYLRQGEPDDIIRHAYATFDDDNEAAGGDGLLSNYHPDKDTEYQSWLFDPTPESQKSIFHFQKHRAAGTNWRLISYPQSDRMLRQLGTWDPVYERMHKPQGGDVDLALIENTARSEARTVVTTALTTDRQSWEKKTATFRFPHAIDVFRSAGGRSLLDISYAIPVATLVQMLPDTVRATRVEVGFSMIDARSHTAEAHLDTVDLDLSRTRTGAIVDLLRYTVPPDSYAVTMHLRPLAGDVFGSWKQTLRVPDFGRHGLMMSSIQLLRPASGTGALQIDGVRVMQSPFRTHVRTEPLYLYLQIYDLMPDGEGTTSYTVECRLFAQGETDWDQGRIIARCEKTGKDQTGVQFCTCDVHAVGAGRYTLVARVTDRMRVESIQGIRDIEILKP